MIEIEKDLEVKNNSLEIRSVFVESVFEDANGNKHSRLMKVDLNTINLVDAKESNELLKQFS